MQKYIKPELEIIGLRPEERLANTSTDEAGGGSQGKCNGNDGGTWFDAAGNKVNGGCLKA
jgi:hypothetical protein